MSLFRKFTKRSSNINVVIRPVLNCYFFTKRFHKYKKAQNIKNTYKKHLSSDINEIIKTL